MQILKVSHILIFLTLFSLWFAPITRSEIVTKIILLVNDIPITQSDFRQRAIFIQTSNPQLAENAVSTRAIQELIDESIKIDAASSMGITYTIDAIELALDNQLKAQGTSLEKYTEKLFSDGTDIKTVINSRIAATVWNKYIIRKYRRFANITISEVEEFRKDLLEKEVFHVQVIKIADNNSSAKRLELAQNISSNFKSCANNLSEYKNITEINIEDIFDIKINDLGEPFKSMLAYKSDQFVLPIQVIDDDVVLMINCCRHV